MVSRNNLKNLALYGGSKQIQKQFKRHNPIAKEELRATRKVLKSGLLSKFLGAWDEDFYGGPQVLQFEKNCSKYFGVKHAISVNSWTSGLIAAVGAIGIEPGDEVIVSPWTMSASALAILHWNGIPVFADIDKQNFCIDPASIRNRITPRTKAIIAVDIFGQSADMNSIMKLAYEFNLKVISDSAQSPGAIYEGKKAGTVAHIGGISLNYHKHIHTGEGGVLFTNDDELAVRMQLIRNHAESVIEGMEYRNLTNMLGYNFRLGEIEAAIGIEQLKKLDEIINRKMALANQLTDELQGLTGLITPMNQSNLGNVYYTYPLVLDTQLITVSRSKIVAALKAEGIPNLAEGYQNLHLLPLFQEKIAYGKAGFPWSLQELGNQTNYSLGICPIAEELHRETYFGFGISRLDLKSKDIQLIGNAFRKVWSNLDELA
jgi:perosamine synthetase